MSVPNFMVIYSVVVVFFDTKNRKCQPHGGARRKVTGPPQWLLGLIMWLSVQSSADSSSWWWTIWAWTKVDQQTNSCWAYPRSHAASISKYFHREKKEEDKTKWSQSFKQLRYLYTTEQDNVNDLEMNNEWIMHNYVEEICLTEIHCKVFFSRVFL